MSNHSALAVVLSLGLAGCAANAARTEAEALQNFDREQQEVTATVPPNYKLLIIDELRRSLKDPYSARDVQISSPAKGFVGLLNGGQGTVVCVRLNAKNSFGGYVGLTTYGYVFRDRMIAAAITDNPLACQGRAYFPFPEYVAALR